MDRQFQFTPYFDSNVHESHSIPEHSFGLKLRGDIRQEILRSRWEAYTDMLAQVFLDVRFGDESKVIANAEFGVRYTLVPRVHILGQLAYFHKSFYGQHRSYQWREYNVYFQITPSNQFVALIGYSGNSTRFTSTDTFRFGERTLEMRANYRFSHQISLEGLVSTVAVSHKDFAALGVENDTLLVALNPGQHDESIRGSVHLRYQRKVIMGIQGWFEMVSSNSVIGEYDQGSYRIYLSGRWGRSNFYHVVLQRLNKNYKYPRLQGVSGYRDPEERIQNRTYIQLERMLKATTVAFIQISFLENETIFNQQYYSKTIIELGIKYDL